MERPPWPFELEPLSWGAESNLYLSTYLGFRVVVKHRFKKPYMAPRLAERLIKERTASEARVLMSVNESGVRAPLPLYIDPGRGLLVMEYIEGALLRDVIAKLSWEDLRRTAETVGLYVARMHSRDLVHGDLTTSNIILRGGEVFLIDFGLSFFSKRPTDKASDLRVLEKAVISSHPGVFDSFFPAFVESYMKHMRDGEEIMKEFLRLSTMGRYYKRRFLF